MKVIIVENKEIKLDMFLLQTACFSAVKVWGNYIREIVITKEINDNNRVIKELAKFAKISVKAFYTIEKMTDYADAIIIIGDKKNEEIQTLIKVAKEKRLMTYVHRTTS